jgi:WW domain
LHSQDAPGTWRKHADEEHNVPFYHNVDTKQSQYNVPPSCAWVKGFMEGSTLYTNTITHQAKWTLPKALAWKQLHNAETNTCGRCPHGALGEMKSTASAAARAC